MDQAQEGFDEKAEATQSLGILCIGNNVNTLELAMEITRIMAEKGILPGEAFILIAPEHLPPPVLADEFQVAAIERTVHRTRRNIIHGKNGDRQQSDPWYAAP